MPNIHFQKATLSYYQTILGWLDEDYVKAFWDNTPEHRQDIMLFMQGRKVPSPYADGIFTYWIGFIEKEPYCLVMTSAMEDDEDLPVYYKACISKTGKTCGLDFMIGNKSFVGKGLAGPTLEAFMQFMRESVDSNIDTFMIDPEEANTRAKRVYEKAGFKAVAEFVSTQGSNEGKKHFLMTKKTKSE